MIRSGRQFSDPSKTTEDKESPTVARKCFATVNVKDAEKGTVELIFSRFNVKDLDNDWTLPGAFESGASVLMSAYGHTSWRGQLPIGKGVIRVEPEYAAFDGRFFLNTVGGRETFETMKETSELQQFSYAYDILETGEVTEDLRQRGVWQVLKKLKVHEVSPVLLGAGIDTQLLSVKGRKAEPTAEELAAAAALETGARQEFARFQKTRARLVAIGRW
jgi:HK97 family phage prohead protease